MVIVTCEVDGDFASAYRHRFGKWPTDTWCNDMEKQFDVAKSSETGYCASSRCMYYILKYPNAMPAQSREMEAYSSKLLEQLKADMSP